MTLTFPFLAFIGKLSFRDHSICLFRAFRSADAAALAKSKVGLIMVAHVFHALRRAVERAEAAIIAFLFVQYRPLRPPAAGIQAEHYLVSVGPRTFRLENHFVLDYHLITSTSRYPLSALFRFLWSISPLR